MSEREGTEEAKRVWRKEIIIVEIRMKAITERDFEKKNEMKGMRETDNESERERKWE